MQPFLIFAAILVVIWTLSGIATWVNKQQEAERRRRVREQMARAGLTPQQPQQPPPRRISQGIAARFPDVLAPPQPVRPVPPRAPMKKQAPRAAAKPARRRQAPAAPIPVLQAAEPEPAHIPMAAMAPAQSAAARSAASGPKANAAALGRWLKPSTLKQQFILTEIFQPPLAMREPHRIG